MSYKAICNVLKKERMANDHIDAVHAKEEYGDRFDSIFTYRKGGQHLVMNKESAIAKHYHTLQKSH
jgi:hypothetical protein